MDIPSWLAQYLFITCPYCGSPITTSPNLTSRYCSNASCPGHLSHKIDKLVKQLNIKGVGPAVALNYIRHFHFTNHLQILDFVLPKSQRPSLYLHEICNLCLIKGINLKWRDITEGCKTMQDVINNNHFLSPYSELLLYAESLFRIKPTLSGKRLNLMLTGSFSGYQERSALLQELNSKYGQSVCCVDVGKRKSNVHFLVKETGTVDHSKTKLATEANIPIITPRELVYIVTQLAKKGSVTDEN
jgi:NAD-dependent DNA ligase